MQRRSSGERLLAISFAAALFAVFCPEGSAAHVSGFGHGHGYSHRGGHHHHGGSHYGGHHTYRYYGGAGRQLGHGYSARHFAPRLHHRGYDRHYGAYRDYDDHRKPRVYGFTIRPQRRDYGPLNGKPMIDWSARDDRRRTQRDDSARRRRPQSR